MGNCSHQVLKRKKNAWKRNIDLLCQFWWFAFKLSKISWKVLKECNARPVDCLSKPGAYLTHNATLPLSTCIFLWSHKRLYTAFLHMQWYSSKICKYTLMCKIRGVLPFTWSPLVSSIHTTLSGTMLPANDIPPISQSSRCGAQMASYAWPTAKNPNIYLFTMISNREKQKTLTFHKAKTSNWRHIYV